MGGRGKGPGKDHQITVREILEQNSVEKIVQESEEMRRRAITKRGGGGNGGIEIPRKKCHCCGEFTLPANSQYEECPNCGWIDDPFQNIHPESAVGRNSISLNQAKANYIQKHTDRQ